MKEGKVLPLHGFVTLPLNGSRHADAQRMRLSVFKRNEATGIDRKDQQTEEGEQRPLAMQEGGAPLRCYAVDDDRNPQMIARLIASVVMETRAKAISTHRNMEMK
jgi:hypothetical protein